MNNKTLYRCSESCGDFVVITTLTRFIHAETDWSSESMYYLTIRLQDRMTEKIEDFHNAILEDEKGSNLTDNEAIRVTVYMHDDAVIVATGRNKTNR